MSKKWVPLHYNAYASGQISGQAYAERIAFVGLTGLAASFSLGITGGAAYGAFASFANKSFEKLTGPCGGRLPTGRELFTSSSIGLFGGGIAGVAGKAGSEFGGVFGGKFGTFHSYEIPAGVVGSIGAEYIGNSLEP